MLIHKQKKANKSLNPPDTWPIPRLKSVLRRLVKETGHFPSRAEIKKKNICGLISAVNKTGGTEYWAEILNMHQD